MLVRWSGGEEVRFPAELLRRACPCATCEEQRGSSSHQKPLSSKPTKLQVIKATKDEAISLERIEPVGNYALSLRWGDGHDTGIYTYALLRELAGLPGALLGQTEVVDASS